MWNEIPVGPETNAGSPAKPKRQRFVPFPPWVALALAWPVSALAWVQAPVGPATFRVELLPASQALVRVSGYQTVGGNPGDCGVVALRIVGPIVGVNQVMALGPGGQTFTGGSLALNFTPSTGATFFFQTNQGGVWQGFATIFPQPVPPALPVELLFTVAMSPSATLAQIESALATDGRVGTDDCHPGGFPVGTRLAVVPLAAPLPNSYSVTVPPGLSTIANNLHRGNNLLDDVLPEVIEGTRLFKFDPAGQQYVAFNFLEGIGWLDDQGAPADTSLAPGEGAWIFSPLEQIIIFTGEPLPPQPAPRPPPGFRLVGGRTPQVSGFEDMLGFPPLPGDQVFGYDWPLPDPPGANPPAPGAGASSIHTFGVSGWDIPPIVLPGKAAFVRLAEPPRPPVILLQPQDQTAAEGETVSFFVLATSEGEPPTFQWYHNGIALPDQTNALLTLTNVQSADAGPYYVRVTSSAGDTWSEIAQLTVTRRNTPPTLETIHHQVVHAGTVVSYRITATDLDMDQHLSFSLEPGAPAAAWIDPHTGLFTWPTTAEDAEEVYPITVRVTDDGTPPLSATQTFTVVVVSAPVLEAINHYGTNVTLTWPAIPCQIYQVLYAPDVTGPWQPLGEPLQATNTTATTREDMAWPARFYRVTTVPVPRVPVCWPSFCFLLYKIHPGPGITASDIAPPAGETTNQVNEPIPLIVTGADTDQLIQTCVCISPEQVCSSSRSLDLADSMTYTWTIVAGEGSLVSADGPATLYRPPNLATGETRTVTIKAEIKDTRGNDKVATITYTIELSRPSECEYKRKVDIARATHPGAPIIITPSPCDCQPQPPAWIVDPALTGDTAGTLKLCVGERHLLRATGTDDDQLRLVCRGTFCGLAIRTPLLLDETRYRWTSALGGFPDYGGAADSNSRKTTVVYKAPDTPGEDEVTITIQDSGQQAPDAPLEKKLKIKLCQVDLQVEGVGEADEECVGRVLPLNKDDDNENDIADKDEAGQVNQENDLIRITLHREPKEGTVTLKATAGGDKIKVWEKPTKETEVVLPKTYPAFDLPKELWVEGVKPSATQRDVELLLESDDPKCQDKAKLTVVLVDLVIHHGLDGVSGGQEISELDEEKKGAVTVANLNDTDGDSTTDADDNDVSVAGANPPGRNEHDLMKLILKKPQPDLGGKVKLVIVAGDVKLWRKATKETEETDREFPTGALDKTLWVEARAVSGSLRDIELRLEYLGCQDTVKATAVWVVRNARSAAQGHNPWATRQATNGFPHNPVAGAGGDLPDLTKASVLDYVNQYTDAAATGQRAADGSRYGHGPFRANRAGGTDAMTGGRIVWEFKVQPSGVDALGVVFDVTRQIEYRDYKIENGAATVDADGSKTFPWLQAPVKDNEMPNDDSHSSDEDNSPSNNLIYSFDGPGHPINAGTRAFVISRNTFKEWVRVKLNNEAFANTQDTVEGSRASDKEDWHCVYYLKRDASGNWTADNNATSASAPVRTGTGNGDAAVALQAGAVTEGFTATFSGGRTWTLTGTSGASVADTQAPAPPGTTWTLALPGRVTVTITQGATGFANGDRFVFSVFKTGDAGGKRNQTGTGAFAVGGAP